MPHSLCCIARVLLAVEIPPKTLTSLPRFSLGFPHRCWGARPVYSRSRRHNGQTLPSGECAPKTSILRRGNVFTAESLLRHITGRIWPGRWARTPTRSKYFENAIAAFSFLLCFQPIFSRLDSRSAWDESAVDIAVSIVSA